MPHPSAAAIFTLLPLVASLLATRPARAQGWDQRYLDRTPFPDPRSNQTPRVATDDELARDPVAPEPAAPRFGQQGEIVLTAANGGSNGAGISYQSVGNDSARFFSASLDLGIDYFVARNFSIGVDLQAAHSDSKGYGTDGSLIESRATSVDGGVRFGANVPLGAAFSFYPRLTLGIGDDHTNQHFLSMASAESVLGNSFGSPSTSQIGPWVTINAPLLVHPSAHFFFGVGPRWNHSFATVSGAYGDAGGQSNSLGASFVIGGWWGGSAPASAPAPSVEEPPTSEEPTTSSSLRERRFGDRGTFVLTNEADGYAKTTTYAGIGSSTLSVLVQPGFDYFIFDHFSVGLDVYVSHARSAGLNTDGSEYTTSSTGFGVAPRFGAEISVTSFLSFYPRSELGVGPSKTNETSNGAQNAHTDTGVWVELEAPLLVHVARHFFVGAGPYVNHDLSRTDQNGFSFPLTTVGANAVIGGWL